MRRALLRKCGFRSRAGQGMVEFVLVAPLLLLLIFGLVEFARAWNIRHVITDAAREGARNLAIDNPVITVDSVQARVNRALQSAGLQPGNATVTIGCEPTACPTGQGVMGESARVSINYPFELRIVKTFLGWTTAKSTLNIGTTFVMRNE